VLGRHLIISQSLSLYSFIGYHWLNTDYSLPILSLMPTVTFRFYAELNDFLPVDQRQLLISHTFNEGATVKDRIEALGVPHTEVEVDGESVDFSFRLQHGHHVTVYPAFHRLDVASLTPLRPLHIGEARFILDIHLGKLANYLRMLGFDTLYRNDYQDEELAAAASSGDRIVLTRDLGVLKRREVIYGYYVRSADPLRQAGEVLHRFDLFDAINPFHRCLTCNGLLAAVDKAAVLHQLEPRTQQYYNEFYRCQSCEQIYWKGSHFTRMQQLIHSLQSTVRNC
jgi:uncharacterized protein